MLHIQQQTKMETQQLQPEQLMLLCSSVITVTGTNPATVELGGTYTDSGATATDLDTVTVASAGTVDTSTVGVYQYIHCYRCFRKFFNCNKTVNVVDTTALYSQTGTNQTAAELSGTYLMQAPATTDLDTVTVTSAETVDTSVVGHIQLPCC